MKWLRARLWGRARRDMRRRRHWEKHVKFVLEREPDGQYTIFIHVPRYVQQHRHVYQSLKTELNTALHWPSRTSRGTIFGNVIPRDILWFEPECGRSYAFSGKQWKAEPYWLRSFERLQRLLNAELGRQLRYQIQILTAQLRTVVEKQALIRSFRRVRVNSVLVNRYKGGADSISPHADNEPFFGRNPTIVSITMGNTRTFVLKRKNAAEFNAARKWSRIRDPWTTPAPNFTASTVTPSKYTFELGNGDLLIMAGAAQDYWHHSIAKQPKIPARSCRYNMTWRFYSDPPKHLPHKQPE